MHLNLCQVEPLSFHHNVLFVVNGWMDVEKEARCAEEGIIVVIYLCNTHNIYCFILALVSSFDDDCCSYLYMCLPFWKRSQYNEVVKEGLMR